MARSPVVDTVPSTQRPDRYRRSQRALALAAQLAAVGHLDGRIEAALKVHGYGGVFAGRAELAAAAQTQWWQRLLGRLDSVLDDDMAGVACAAMTGAVQQAWLDTVCELPGYLALAASAAADPTVRRGTLRYARMLALFAGRSAVDDDPIMAARVGLTLVESLSHARGSTGSGSGSAQATATAPSATAPETARGNANASAAGASAGAVSALFRSVRRVRQALSLTTT